jgi:putative endonuclease
MHTRKKGGIAEEFACDYLSDKGYQILERNFHARVGELDIICKIGDELVFCEVKSLKEDMGQEIYATLSKRKLINLQKAVYYWLNKNKLAQSNHRLDFVGVVLDKNNIPLKIEHFTHVGEDKLHIY